MARKAGGRPAGGAGWRQDGGRETGEAATVAWLVSTMVHSDLCGLGQPRSSPPVASSLPVPWVKASCPSRLALCSCSEHVLCDLCSSSFHGWQLPLKCQLLVMLRSVRWPPTRHMTTMLPLWAVHSVGPVQRSIHVPGCYPRPDFHKWP